MGQADQRSGTPATESTSAGPSACAAFDIAGSTRAGSRQGHGRVPAVRSRSAAATASGTEPTGSANSIGTRTSCVGTAEPMPTSNSTRETAT